MLISYDVFAVGSRGNGDLSFGEFDESFLRTEHHIGISFRIDLGRQGRLCDLRR